jgi:hypothetical protein
VALMILCLEFKDEGVKQFSNIQDSYLAKVLNSNKRPLMNKTIFEEPPNLMQLKLKLLETDILPLDGKAENNLDSFWNTVKERSDKLSAPSQSFVNYDHMGIHLQRLTLEYPNAEIVPRGLPRRPSIHHKNGNLNGLRSVSFNTNERNDGDKPNALIAGLIGAKDTFMNLLFKKEQGVRRRNSYSSSNQELPIEDLLGKDVKEEESYMKAVMKENSRLREQLLKSRSKQDISSDSSPPKRSSTLTEGLRHPERNAKVKDWMERQHRMVSEPTSMSSSSSYHDAEDINHLASAVAAGVTAYHHVTSNLKKRRNSTKVMDESVATSRNVAISDKIEKRPTLSKAGGFHLMKPTFEQLKQQNDKLVSALGAGK